MRHVHVLAVALAATTAACFSAEKAPADDSATRPVADTGAVAPALGVKPTATNLQCTPATLKPGDVLTLRMSLPHGPVMMAIAPDSTQFIVVFHGEGQLDRGQRKSLLPPDAFAKTTELSLDPKTLMAGAWVSGRDTNELLFRRPGTYRLLVGSDMETDGPQYAECLVRYAP